MYPCVYHPHHPTLPSLPATDAHNQLICISHTTRKWYFGQDTIFIPIISLRPTLYFVLSTPLVISLGTVMFLISIQPIYWLVLEVEAGIPGTERSRRPRPVRGFPAGCYKQSWCQTTSASLVF